MFFHTKSLEFDIIINKIIANTKSFNAKNLLKNITPSTKLLEVEDNLLETKHMLDLIVKHKNLPFYDDFDNNILNNYRNIERIFSIDELLEIKLFLTMEKAFYNYKRHIKDTKNRILENYLNKLVIHNPLMDQLTLVFNEQGTINDNATTELYKIRRSINNLASKLDDKMQQLLNSYESHLTERVIVTRNNRLCLSVKEASKNKIKGVIHDVSASGQTFFIEPEASLQITAEIEINKLEEAKEINKILISLTNETLKHINTLLNNFKIYIHLDVLAAKAIYGLAIDGILPKINNQGLVKLINAKHPLLNKKEAVPISLELNTKYNMLLITGPNTGGKTVALKTVGLLSLMVQSGILIPADYNSEFNIFDNIFADIGDEQSIENSLSTFSSHMTKIVKMLDDLSDNTLILLDELGSGTDPNEGVAIAISIIEAFREKDIKLIVTSHYSELKNYAYETEGIKTASVAFDKDSLKPLYYLQHGISGESHARLIAKRLGMKQSVIELANMLFDNRQSDLGKIMAKLNDERNELDKIKNDLELEKVKYLEAKDKYDKEYEKNILAQERIIEEITIKEEAKWNKAIKEIKDLIFELEDINTMSEPRLADIKGKINIQPKKAKVKSDEILNIGDQVLIKPYNQYGNIVKIDNNKYQVVFGMFDLEFNKEDLKLVEESKVSKPKVIKRVQKNKDVLTKSGKTEVDLRGYRYEEVKEALDDAINDALLSNLHSLSIIHGFGTGAIRNAVHEYIKGSKYIKSHRYGKEGEGLQGVTIIELK